MFVGGSAEPYVVQMNAFHSVILNIFFGVSGDFLEDFILVPIVLIVNRVDPSRGIVEALDPCVYCDSEPFRGLDELCCGLP